MGRSVPSGSRAAAVAAALLVTAGCSGASGGGKAVTVPTAAPGTAASSVSPVEPSPTESLSPGPSATPSPSVTSVALTGPLRNDPGVKFLVNYFKVLAKATNEQNANLPALVALETKEQRPYSVKAVKAEYGNIAPDTVPFVPLSVGATSGSRRFVNICAVDDGWTLNPKTMKPARKKTVLPIKAQLTKAGTSYKVELFDANFSCAKAGL